MSKNYVKKLSQNISLKHSNQLWTKIPLGVFQTELWT